MSAVTLIPFDEVVQLDSALVQWWEDLPSMLTKDSEETIPSFLKIPRLVMKWRYQNLRIILHRPYLLSFALRKISYDRLTAEEKVSIGKCRIIAAKTIEDISNECRQDVISAWNGVVSVSTYHCITFTDSVIVVRLSSSFRSPCVTLLRLLQIR
jgi:hypothetical protein